MVLHMIFGILIYPAIFFNTKISQFFKVQGANINEPGNGGFFLIVDLILVVVWVGIGWKWMEYNHFYLLILMEPYEVDERVFTNYAANKLATVYFCLWCAMVAYLAFCGVKDKGFGHFILWLSRAETVQSLELDKHILQIYSKNKPPRSETFNNPTEARFRRNYLESEGCEVHWYKTKNPAEYEITNKKPTLFSPRNAP